MLYKIKIIDSTNFTSALKVTLAAVIPVLLFTFYGNFQMGFAMALGAIFAYQVIFLVVFNIK
jgi:uncharacterized membrane protein YccC